MPQRACCLALFAPHQTMLPSASRMLWSRGSIATELKPGQRSPTLAGWNHERPMLSLSRTPFMSPPPIT